MKVLHVINSLQAGGAEKLVTEMAMKLADQNIDVTILLLNGQKTPLYQQLVNHPIIKIISLTEDKSIYNPLLLFKIKPILRKFDIVHVHLFPAMYWVALAKLTQLKKSTVIFTEHSSHNKRRGKLVTKLIDRFIYKQFNQIITISNIVDENIKAHLGISGTPFKLIHNGIDLEKINDAIPYSKEDLGFEDNDKIIIQVSSFRYPKDQFTVIKALSRLPSEIKLILVGDGPLKLEAERLAKTLQVNHRIHFLGLRNDVPSLLKSVDIIVLASHYEGLSLSSIEGMAAGKPFIASNAPGLRDVVNGHGLVFEDKNDKALAQIIDQLIKDNDFYQKISSQCLQRSKNFELNVTVKKHINLYKANLPS